MATLIEKAAEILARCETVVITSINQEGYPRPVPMSNIKSEGATTVWLATGKDSLKTKEFAANPKAGLCFQEKGNSVVLTDEVEIIEDRSHQAGNVARVVQRTLQQRPDRSQLCITEIQRTPCHHLD